MATSTPVLGPARKLLRVMMARMTVIATTAYRQRGSVASLPVCPSGGAEPGVRWVQDSSLFPLGAGSRRSNPVLDDPRVRAAAGRARDTPAQIALA